MAITLHVSQSGDRLLVAANNGEGTHTAIIDHIVVSIGGDRGWSWLVWYYQDDFYFGSDVPVGSGKLMVEMNYRSGPARMQATADYWEVDKRVTSPTIAVS
jgi:hypothetical protein